MEVVCVALGSSGSCCLECRGLTSCGRGGGGAEFWTCFRTCLVYPVSFLKLFTACLRNLLAMRLSGETSDCLHVKQMCSSESNRVDLIHSSQ